MATSLHDRATLGEEKVRILPPEHAVAPPAGAPRRAIGWIVAFMVAMTALVAVVVVEEIRIRDRDDTIAGLQQDVTAMQGEMEGQQAVIRDVRLQLTAALEQGAVTGARIDRLRTELTAAQEDVVRLDERSAAFQARAERLSATLSTWVPPVADGDYSGYLLGANATADPARIAFEAVESEGSGQWFMVPVSPTATVTVWSYPLSTTQERTEDLAFLDRMFSIDAAWAEYHREAWYEVVVLDGVVTEIHQAAPLD